MERSCLQCGDPLDHKHHKAKFCTLRCKNAWHRKNNNLQGEGGYRPRTCVVCGQKFKPNSSRALTCGSDECRKTRMRDYFRKWRAKQRESPANPKETVDAINEFLTRRKAG